MICNGCFRAAVRLYDHNDRWQCRHCVFADAKAYGGFGFGPHGRAPWPIIEEIYADVAAAAIEAHKAAKENPSREAA